MEDSLTQTTLGDLVAAVYETLMEEYGDPELASVATAAIVHDMVLRQRLKGARKASAA